MTNNRERPGDEVVPPVESRFVLRLTEANHGENMFFELASTSFDTAAERQDALDALPTDLGGHDCDTAPACYIVDVEDGDDFTVVANVEIPEHVARQLAGTDNFEPQRELQRLYWSAMAQAAAPSSPPP